MWVFEVFLSTSLDIQQFILKLAMKSNTLDAMVKPINANLVNSFNIQSFILFCKTIFQVGSDCHGTSFWECGG